MANLRSIVLEWDPCTEPTKQQYDMAYLWVHLSGGRPFVSASDLAKIKELIRRYELNHPELFLRSCNE